ncbi:amidohydrolase [Ruegeria conchae]|uniref:amidohydrolase n=1 Tax=Ruegeria conchae TaxID=981384 RepID=UPI0029C968A5|nr:amidohydrolase [Ruegeria conchae]
MKPELQSWLTEKRHELHQVPEISGEERGTAASISNLLLACGPDAVLTGIGGHGVAAVYESGQPGPTIGIRCELDGLPIQEISSARYASQHPGKGHLCGHDGHMAMVLGVAFVLGDKRPAKGRVVLIFQPAEETGQGAIAFRADPKFANIAPDYVYSLHNLPGLELGAVELCSGPANCASRGMRIVLTGKTSHAAAPQDGLSPAGALAELIPALAALGHGGALDADYALTTVTHARLGETTFGVAPGMAELWVTLRTVSDTRMTGLIREAEQLVSTSAQAHGLGVEISYDDVFEACVNTDEAVQIMSDACQTRDIPCKLVPTPQRFSEDFGQFGKGAKTAMFWLGAGRDHPQLHNPDYDFPDALIPIGTDIFLAAIEQTLKA